MRGYNGMAVCLFMYAVSLVGSGRSAELSVEEEVYPDAAFNGMALFIDYGMCSELSPMHNN